MAWTSRSLQTELESFLDHLMNMDIAIYTTRVKNRNGEVGWYPLDPDARLIDRKLDRTVFNYRYWIDTGAYSAILSDGALLQISYRFAGRMVVGHRLAYVPCPFKIDSELLQMDPLAEVFDMYAEQGAGSVVLDSVVRFDYDVERAGPEHPATHLTINSADCRIACMSPMTIGDFTSFVFRHFYPEIWRADRYIRGLRRGGIAPSSLTEDERKFHHISWAV